MDIKKLKFIIGTLINTRFGYGTLVGIDEEQGVFQMRMAKDIPMFLEEADLLLTNDDYKRASMQHRVIQLSELRQNTCKLVDESKKQRVLAEENEKTQRLNLNNIEKQLAKLRESMSQCNGIGKCYKTGNERTQNAIYYRVDTTDLKCLSVDWRCEKSPIVKMCKLTYSDISELLTEINPETFEERMVDAVKFLRI